MAPVPECILRSVDVLELRRGQTLAGALGEFGFDRGTVQALARALGQVLDLRTLRPKERILVYRTRTGVLDRLEYERGLGERVVVEPGPVAFSAREERDPEEVTFLEISGTVSSNLYLSMIEASGGPGLVDAFADLFAWDFDFTTDTRNGDRFELLVEERRIAGERAGFGRILAGRYVPLGSDPLEVFGSTAGEDWAYYSRDGRPIQKLFLKSPLNYRRISSHFTHSRLHPILKTRRPHLGIDYAAPAGTPVVALGSGKVELAGTRGGFGRTVRLVHANGYLTQYAHLSRYAKGIRAGSRVKQGEIIGYVGSTGLSTGPHLDFRVSHNGVWIDPLRVEGGSAPSLTGSDRDLLLSRVASIDTLFERLSPGEGVAAVETGPEGPSAPPRLDTPSAS